MTMMPPIIDNEMPLSAPGVDRMERNLRYLDQLIEVGMKLAMKAAQDALAPQTQAEEPPKPANDPQANFVRLTRTVHHCMLLQEKLGAVRTTLIKNVRQERKEKIGGIVGSAISSQSPPLRSGKLAHLMETLNYRLSCPDIDQAIRTKPISAIAAGLCANLGIEPDWSQWENEAWVAEEADTPESYYTEHSESEEDEDDPPEMAEPDATGPPDTLAR